MNFSDMTRMGFYNLWRTRLRTALTILGVVIGIGALTSMVSFGTGMQKNFTDAIKKSDLFTSLHITPGEINFEELSQGDISGIGDMIEDQPEPLNDSLLNIIKNLPGVVIAFPEETFPARVMLDNKENSINIQPIPIQMGDYYPFNDLLGGSFFPNDSSNSIILTWETLRNLGFIIDYPENKYILTKEDSLKGKQIIIPDSLIGRTIIMYTATIDKNIVKNPLSILMKPKFDPFTETEMVFTISGILKRREEFSIGGSSGGAFITMETGKAVPRLNFSSVWDILNRDRKEGNYSSIYVRVEKMEDVSPIRKEIENMGLGVFSIADELKEMKQVFLIMDSLLGAIGTVALIIAALGIINTMIMSIMERTREIGIMKAVGGSENQIKMIFFVEAAFIGLIGALFGLALGWFVSRIANIIINTKLSPLDGPSVDLFYFPLWLIMGAIAFSILVSLAAGLYPAIRAARIDPVRALRHD
jgi:ABC-type antimicrobial peptide transport system permease subunit